MKRVLTLAALGLMAAPYGLGVWLLCYWSSGLLLPGVFFTPILTVSTFGWLAWQLCFCATEQPTRKTQGSGAPDVASRLRCGPAVGDAETPRPPSTPTASTSAVGWRPACPVCRSNRQVVVGEGGKWWCLRAWCCASF